MAAVLAAAVTFAGCTSMKTIHPARPGEPPFGPVKRGDTVVVHTRDGESARVVVQQIDGETLIAADGRRYVRSDLQLVQRKALDRWKTTELVVGLAAGALVVFVSAMASWLGENSCYECD
jgi:uncharacterized lipoprotein YajG